MTTHMFEVDEFLASLANDEELARELLVAFLEDSPARVRELGDAIGSGDTPVTAKVAHSLKGMCGVVRSTQLSAMALNMEQAARDGRLDTVRETFPKFSELMNLTHEEMKAYLG